MSWDDLDRDKFIDERAAVAALLARRPLSAEDREEVRQEAEALVRFARKGAARQGVVESFLQEFSLSTREGLALMRLAEALLRTPDEGTRDRLIAEKIASADWASHLGRSDSLLVNASTWSLMLTGKLIDPDEEARADLPGFIRRLAGRLGEPVIRQTRPSSVRAPMALSVPSTCWGRGPALPLTPTSTRGPMPTPSPWWAIGPRARAPKPATASR